MAVSVVEQCRRISGCRLFGESTCLLLRSRSVWRVRMLEVMQTGCNEGVSELARKLNRLSLQCAQHIKIPCKIPLLAVICKRKFKKAFALNRYYKGKIPDGHNSYRGLYEVKTRGIGPRLQRYSVDIWYIFCADVFVEVHFVL